jgi:hypothetical protein
LIARWRNVQSRLRQSGMNASDHSQPDEEMVECSSHENYRFSFHNYPRFSDELAMLITHWRRRDKDKIVFFLAELCPTAGGGGQPQPSLVVFMSALGFFGQRWDGVSFRVL